MPIDPKVKNDLVNKLCYATDIGPGSLERCATFVDALLDALTPAPPVVRYFLDSGLWPEAEGWKAPEYQTQGAVGADLRSAETVIVPAHGRCAATTGMRVELPPGYEAQIRPRSGLAKNHGITVANSPGTVDEDYRGPIVVLLQNHSDSDFVINRGDRIAQMVVARYVQATFVGADSLSETQRGTGGFGSTGSK